jgi:malate/lactate dehydrogenase
MFSCSALLSGEYGYEGFSVTVPAVLGRVGVHQILEWELSPTERGRLEQSAAILKSAACFVEATLEMTVSE